MDCVLLVAGVQVCSLTQLQTLTGPGEIASTSHQPHTHTHTLYSHIVITADAFCTAGEGLTSHTRSRKDGGQPGTHRPLVDNKKRCACACACVCVCVCNCTACFFLCVTAPVFIVVRSQEKLDTV